MSFNPLTQPIDHFELAGQRSPGIAEIADADGSAELQERRGYGLGGAYVVYKGQKLVHFKATIKLTTQDDWDAWHEFRALLQRPPVGRRARALDIWHPILEDAGITSVLVEKLGQPVRDGDDGAWTVTVAFCEYRRPTRALSTPDGSDTEQLTPTELAILAQQNANQNATRQRDALAAEVLGR